MNSRWKALIKLVLKELLDLIFPPDKNNDYETLQKTLPPKEPPAKKP